MVDKSVVCRMIRAAVKDEADATMTYPHLKSKLPDKEDRDRVEGIRDDEVRHYKMMKTLSKKMRC